MATHTLTAALAKLSRASAEPDGDLLARFARGRDEQAFAALVDRHAKLVWGVAARHAADRHAAEDAFQATFFALARLAGRLDGRASLAGWLHTVAARAARRTRRARLRLAANRDPSHEPDPLEALSARELVGVVDDEILRLPERYRQPLVLCCLEGLSRDEAAARLGWPAGALKGRLERGRERLRKRLLARGIELPAALAAVAVAPGAVPAGLRLATPAAAARFADAAALGAAAELARWAVRAAVWPRRAMAAVLLATTMAVGGGVGVAVSREAQPSAAAADAPKEQPAPGAKAGANEEAMTVRVVAAGKPAAGAKVWAFEEPRFDPDAAAPPEPTPLVAGPDGAVRFPLARFLGRDESVRLFARDLGGRVAGAEFHPSDRPPPDRVIVLELVDTTSLPGMITDAAGRPLAGAEVRTGLFAPPLDRSGRDDAFRAGVRLPPWDAGRRPARTDAAGRFDSAGAPAGWVAAVWVRSPANGHVAGAVRVGEPFALVLPAAGAVRVAVGGDGTAADLAGARWHVGPVESAGGRRRSPVGWPEPVPGRPPELVSYANGTVAGPDGFVVPNLTPGRYVLSIAGEPGPVRATPPGEVVVRPGETAEVVVRLARQAKLTGRVIDADAKTPVPGAGVGFYTPEGGRAVEWVQTDADGRYVGYAPPGTTLAASASPPAGYLPLDTGPGRRYPTPTVKVTAEGHTFPDIELRKGVPFRGVVRDAAGRPVVATVDPATTDPGQPLPVITSAATDGAFEIANQDPDDQLAPRVRRGDAVNVPAAVPVRGVATITVAEANACRVAGRVTDGRGNPVPGAKVSVQWHVTGAGKSRYGFEKPLETLTAGADGRYRSSALWPGDGYHVAVTAPGYGRGESAKITGSAGQTHELATVQLLRSSLEITGVVVDASGTPVPGAVAFNHGDGERDAEAATDPAGRFSLRGFADRPAFAFAKKDGYRLAFAPADPGGDPVRLVLRKTTDPPAPVPPAAAHAAAVDRLTRHLIEGLWAERAKLKGSEVNVFDAAARFDPALARRLAEADRLAPAGKTDFTARLRRLEVDRVLFDVAKADLGQALGLLTGRRGSGAADTLYDLGRRMLPVDRGKAAHLADEAAARARSLPAPDRAYQLARAGALMARAGNRDAGKALAAEAAKLAETLPADGSRASFYRALAAVEVLAFDRPAAEALLAPYPNADEYNRYLSLAVDRVAAFDPVAARGLLDKFRTGHPQPERSARQYLAYRLAASDPAAAEALVAGVGDKTRRILGYAELARVVARTDRPKAWALIDAAYHLLPTDTDPGTFPRWGVVGGASGVAAIVTVAARDTGYPDLAGGVARVLALRRAETQPRDRDTQAVGLALLLALADPVTAGRVLAGAGPPGGVGDRASSSETRRVWLHAVALATPEAATAVVDARLRALAGGGGDAELVGLASLLTSPDRFRDIEISASLPRTDGGSEARR